MLKYLIIAGIFGCIALYLLWGVLALGFTALTESAPAERRFAFPLSIWWLGPLIVSGIISAAAICRIVTLRKRAQEKPNANVA